MSARHDAEHEFEYELNACVVEYDNQPNQCTIFPSDVPERHQTTMWITAFEGAYVSIDDMQ